MKLTITSLFTDEPAAFALKLANSVDPARQPSDLLADPDSAIAFLAPHLDQGEDPLQVAKRLIPFRDALRRGFQYSASTRKVPSNIEKRLTSALASHWQMTTEGQGKSVVHLKPEGSAEQCLSAWAALGYFSILQGKPERLRICESEPCEEIFQDDTKSKRQRFCSKRCANRFNVARYRSRQSQ